MTIATFTIGGASVPHSTLYCGDCREIIDSLTFDACITDPPYGLSKVLNRSWNSFSKIKNKRQRHRNLHSGGTWAAKEIYKEIDWDDETPDVTFLLERNVPTMIFGGNYFTGLPSSRKWIAWDKGEPFYRRSFAEMELCWCSFDGNARIFKYIPDFRAGTNSKVHPTQKPVKLMLFCISELPRHTGNIICDPYMGSGTTGVAAIQMGRAFIGIEQNKKYFDIACQRIERAYTDYQNHFPEVREMIKQRQLFDEKETA